jgi:murein L,D-transpeptidase YafK
MKRVLCLLTGMGLLALSSFTGGEKSFRKEQMKAPKVLVAYQEKWPELKKRIHEMHLDTNAFSIFIRGFKKEKKLEVWLRSKKEVTYQLFSTYDICSSSGLEGPKRREGDDQVPEGFYKISVFNPYSNYYVSLGLNYPNQSDRILGHKNELGGAIMIHGNCVTIGCIPITDEKIKELYVLAAEARNSGQADIWVHIFPEILNAENISRLETEHKSDPALITFWKNLKSGYEYFEKRKQVPAVRVDANGVYDFK